MIWEIKNIWVAILINNTTWGYEIWILEVQKNIWFIDSHFIMVTMDMWPTQRTRVEWVFKGPGELPNGTINNTEWWPVLAYGYPKSSKNYWSI